MLYSRQEIFKCRVGVGMTRILEFFFFVAKKQKDVTNFNSIERALVSASVQIIQAFENWHFLYNVRTTEEMVGLLTKDRAVH